MKRDQVEIDFHLICRWRRIYECIDLLWVRSETILAEDMPIEADFGLGKIALVFVEFCIVTLKSIEYRLEVSIVLQFVFAVYYDVVGHILASCKACEEL